MSTSAARPQSTAATSSSALRDLRPHHQVHRRREHGGLPRRRTPPARRAPVRAVRPVAGPLYGADPCRCVAGATIAYRDEDGDRSCARCGRLLSPATARIGRDDFDELAELMTVGS